MQHVVLGQYDDVEQMLQVCPELLRLRGTARNYQGDTIKDVTALQAALGAGDVRTRGGMVQMIAGYFKYLNVIDGFAEYQRQYQQQFPNGAPDLLGQPSYDFNLLVETIANSSIDDIWAYNRQESDPDCALCKVMNAFHNEPCFQPRIITVGEAHFQLYAMLINAHDCYAHYVDDWEFDDPRKLFFEYKVIGYILSFLPACDIQAVFQEAGKRFRFNRWAYHTKLYPHERASHIAKVRRAEVDYGRFNPDEPLDRRDLSKYWIEGRPRMFLDRGGIGYHDTYSSANEVRRDERYFREFFATKISALCLNRVSEDDESTQCVVC